MSVDTVLMGQSRHYKAYSSAVSSINHLSFPKIGYIQRLLCHHAIVLYYKRSFYNDTIYINAPNLCCRRNDSRKEEFVNNQQL